MGFGQVSDTLTFKSMDALREKIQKKFSTIIRINYLKVIFRLL